MKALALPIEYILLLIKSLYGMVSREFEELTGVDNDKYTVRHISIEDNDTRNVEIVDSNGVCKEVEVDKDDIKSENIAIGSSVCFISGKLKSVIQ